MGLLCPQADGADKQLSYMRGGGKRLGGCEQQLGVGGFKTEMLEASEEVILHSGLLEAVVPGEPRCRQQPAQVRRPGPPGTPVQPTFTLLCSWYLPTVPRTIFL